MRGRSILQGASLMPRDQPNSTSIARKLTAQIRKYVEEQGLSQAELAEQLNCSRSYVNKLLKGEENLTSATMEKLAEALGLELSVNVQPRKEPISRSLNAPETVEEGEEQRDKDTADLLDSLQVQTADDVRATIDTWSPEARRELTRLVRETISDNGKRAKPGRKKGSGADCRPQMLHMALLLEGDDPPSEREASRLAEEWAAEQRAAGTQGAANLPELLSAETLRGRFRRNKTFYLREARKILAKERQEVAGAHTNDGPPSTVPGRAGGSSARTPLSGLSSVKVELDRIAERFGLSDDSVALLRTPGVLEEIGRLDQIDEMFAATSSVSAEATAPDKRLSRLVNEPIDTMRSVTSGLKITTTWDRLKEQIDDASILTRVDDLRATTTKLEELMGPAARALDLFK